MSTTDTSTKNSRCSQCEGDRGQHPLFCISCKHLFPEPESLNHFERLGMGRTFEIAEEELEERLLEISRYFHPDFFAAKDEDQQERSLNYSASLNEAYSTLRNAFERAEYLLLLYGGSGSNEDKSVPPGFLEETLMLREEIEEALEDGSEETIAEIHQQLSGRQQEYVSTLCALFEKMEEKGKEQGTLTRIRAILNAAKYLNNLVRDSAGLLRPR